MSWSPAKQLVTEGSGFSAVVTVAAANDCATISNSLPWGRNRRTIFAIASGEEAIGCIGMLPQDDVASISAEVGYWLGEPFWNRGITTGALKALTKYAFGELGLVRL